jgi:hypothetical protein
LHKSKLILLSFDGPNEEGRVIKLRKWDNKNSVLSSAVEAVSKTFDKVEGAPIEEVCMKDAIVLQECASVIARSSAGEILSAMKGLRAVSQE